MAGWVAFFNNNQSINQRIRARGGRHIILDRGAVDYTKYESHVKDMLTIARIFIARSYRNRDYETLFENDGPTDDTGDHRDDLLHLSYDPAATISRYQVGSISRSPMTNGRKDFISCSYWLYQPADKVLAESASLSIVS